MATTKTSKKTPSKKTPSKKKTTKKLPSRMRVSQGALAREIIGKINQVAKELKLAPSLTDEQRRSLLPGMSVPDELIELVASASDEFGASIGTAFDSDHARQSIARYRAYDAASNAVLDLARRLGDFALEPRSRAGRSALLVYGAMRGLVRTPEGARMRSTFEAMAEQMKRSRRKPAKRSRGGEEPAPVEPS